MQLTSACGRRCGLTDGGGCKVAPCRLRPGRRHACMPMHARASADKGSGSGGSGSSSLGDVIRSIFDFESWAPRSSRQWRLRPVPGEAQLKAGPGDAGFDDTALLDDFARRAAEVGAAQPGGAMGADDAVGLGGRADVDLSDSLRRRMAQLNVGGNSGSAGAGALVWGGDGAWGSEEDIDAARGAMFDSAAPLTGAVLRELVYAKYGRYYDLSIVRRDIPGRSLVRLNVMWTHLQQVSFPMSPREYNEKLETIAFYVRSWGQEQVVRDFFREPPKAKRGLPARPTTGSAISIRFDLSQAQVDEWFGQ